MNKELLYYSLATTTLSYTRGGEPAKVLAFDKQLIDSD